MEAKRARADAKELVTRKIKEITQLMAKDNNVDIVSNKVGELREAFQNFQASHEQFHSQLKDEESIEESVMCYELVSDRVKQLQDSIELWIAGIETSKLVKSFDDNPEDSISNVGSRQGSMMSRKSSASTRSSVSSARAKAAAKKAILEAEAATIKQLHKIQEEELRLRQRKNELKLETEMAKAKAEESAYAQAEQREMAAHLPPPEQPKSTPLTANRNAMLDNPENFIVIDEIGATPNGTSNIIEHRLPNNESTAIKSSEPYGTRPSMQETPLSSRPPLNPEASEFRYKSSISHQPSLSPGLVPNPNSGMQHLLQQQQEAIMALTLPQPTVPVFNGDPIEYCDFMRAFENLIERKTSSPSARLYYLLQYTGGQVQDLVRSCLAMRDDRGYSEARKLLAERNGQPYKIASAYVNRVINGQPIQ